jgi:hypothetical protein
VRRIFLTTTFTFESHSHLCINLEYVDVGLFKQVICVKYGD